MNPDSESDAARPDPEQWLEEYGDHLHGYAMFRTGDPNAVEDLVQDTLLAGCKAWDRFEGRSTVKTWLTAILNRKIIDYYRKRGRERKWLVPYEESDDEGSEFTAEGRILPEYGAKKWSAMPDKLAEDSDFWVVLQGCVDKLPHPQREIFVSREIDERTTEEISETHDVTPNHLWVIIHRARKALRKCLEVHWFSEP